VHLEIKISFAFIIDQGELSPIDAAVDDKLKFGQDRLDR